MQGEARRVIRGGVMEEEEASNAWYDLEVERRWKGEKRKKKSKNQNINMLNIGYFRYCSLTFFFFLVFKLVS